MSFSRKLAVLFAAAVGVAGLSLSPTASAQVQDSGHLSQSVDAAADKCKRQKYSNVAYTFHRGPSKIPLRCGTKTWGYKHVVNHGRWSTSFKNKINDTLWKGHQVRPGVIYRYKPGTGCSPRPVKNFKVVYNTGPLGGKPGGLTPQGIITATVEYTPRSAKTAC
ncbi:hypothetical protein RCO28_36210 [Streptomyces sp. LHD-70]|uniref:hypothetical protein n=1 Tax=Streptomyces sp. LHD-70 TaxID=3072140 RepID=UPI00280E95AA|nr:hypothetical protein [Streptomyces sp. LHD-70]MDQ8707874.1 hypothetical protein [Streptomyces sp. LHD-70]